MQLRLTTTIILAAAALTASVLTTSCGDPINIVPGDFRQANGVYYWKTVLDYDSTEIDFVQRHNVGRLYLRMFDIVTDNKPGTNAPEYNIVPNASLHFNKGDYWWGTMLTDTIDCVPVVYITLDAMKAMADDTGEWARRIVTRVANMCSYNDVDSVSEMQLDCDWTASTRLAFFTLCDSVKSTIADKGLDWRLSSTIRLHQLSQPTPPVDRGVLMVYNTGSFADPDAANSILSVADVAPYLKHLRRYPLHLDVAYPTYSWQLLFRNRQFVGLLRQADLCDTVRYKPLADNRYRVLTDVPNGKTILRKGDIVRVEQSDFATIDSVKALIDKQLSNRPHNTIIYHLDKSNLQNYTSDEIDAIYR